MQAIAAPSAHSHGRINGAMRPRGLGITRCIRFGNLLIAQIGRAQSARSDRAMAGGGGSSRRGKKSESLPLLSF
jgi:hypothetical protein